MMPGAMQGANMTNVTVLGAGAWGTAFGQVLADAGNNVTMWAIEPEIVEGFLISRGFR